MKSMKKLLNKDDSGTLFDHTEPHLQAAMSMEARSRSPLPPTLDSQSDAKPRPQPAKPPRKHLPSKPVDKYDHIEVRNDAWRTLGVGDVDHTESMGGEEDDDEYMSWGDVKPPSQVSANQAPKIIRQESNDSNYDKLEFFGSTTKLVSGYKQVAVASGLNVSCHSFNEYDEVQPALEEVRSADDSHLGYAMVKKKPDVHHDFHNNEPYAVISKPKRV